MAKVDPTYDRDECVYARIADRARQEAQGPLVRQGRARVSMPGLLTGHVKMYCGLDLTRLLKPDVSMPGLLTGHVKASSNAATRWTVARVYARIADRARQGELARGFDGQPLGVYARIADRARQVFGVVGIQQVV